jgi:hypothetical protein
MRLRFIHVVAFVGCALGPRLPAQAATRSDPVGTWRGTSLCLVKPSACHDEVVVYRITRTSKRDSLSMDARKIVNGVEEEMGILGCELTTPAGPLTCTLPRGAWSFTVRGDSLIGDLRLSDGTKFRDVRTVRAR